MNRSLLKFRSWHGRRKSYHYWGYDAMVDGAFLGPERPDQPTEMITGRHDLDGNPIYEGDILKISFGIPVTTATLLVTFKNGCFTTYCHNARPAECRLEAVPTEMDCTLAGNWREDRKLWPWLIPEELEK